MSDMTNGRGPLAAAPTLSRHERDEGSTLIFVLLLVVIAGLVVVPLMTYATSVLRLNTAVSERTKDVEAAKAGLRVALTDPGHVFTECDDGGSLGSVTVNGTPVTTGCAELEEFGPLDALGYQVPAGAVAMQLGSEVPATAAGATLQSDPVPPYPDDSLCSGTSSAGCWWSSHLPTTPDEPWDAVDDLIWLPELPRRPSNLRSTTPYAMSSGFDAPSGIECKVYFPGRYEDPLVLGGSTYYYFASGVYYFDEPVTVQENADVVVGFGLEDFAGDDRPPADRSECADDLQVSRNVVDGPNVLAIDGGGATWVFGDNARLIVDDSAGSPSIRFNQRYSEEDRGGRISIMTVNGVSDGSAVAKPHDVPMVNYVPASQELDTYDEDNDRSNATAINAIEYVPSNETYTDAARLPAAPNVTVTAGRYQSRSGGSQRGALIAWDELLGNEAGGALVTGFDVDVSNGIGTVCDQPGDIVYTAAATEGDPGRLECYITGLSNGQSYTASVAAINVVGTGPAGTDSFGPSFPGPNDGYPDPVLDVTVEDTDVMHRARVSWTPGPRGGDAPITGYTATMERLYSGTSTDYGPRLFGYKAGYADFDGPYLEIVGNNPVGTRIFSVDPNGGPVELEIDQSTVPAGWSIDSVTPGSLDVIVTPPATGSPSLLDPAFKIGFDVTDTDFPYETVSGTFTVDWRTTYVYRTPDAKSFDAYPVANQSYVVELPAMDPRGRPLTYSLDTSNFDGNAEWTIEPLDDNTLTVTTTATTDDPTEFIRLNYTATNGSQTSDPAAIDFFVPVLLTEPWGSCTVDATPWFPTEQSCEIDDLWPLGDPSDIGYRARVEATNAVDVADITNSEPDAAGFFPLTFEGLGSAAAEEPVRIVDAWVPEPIIDIRAGSANAARVRIAGYVAVPMGRVRVDNPHGDANDSIHIGGGVVAGTYEMNDDDVDTVIGFFNDIVLQRRVRITSTAGDTSSIAVVQVNEDGAAYAINSWVID